MDENYALKLFRTLRREAKGRTLTDEQVRRLTGMHQFDIDLAAEQLAAEGLLVIQRTYTLMQE
jgi:hypothetical protein